MKLPSLELLNTKHQRSVENNGVPKIGTVGNLRGKSEIGIPIDLC